MSSSIRLRECKAAKNIFLYGNTEGKGLEGKDLPPVMAGLAKVSQFSEIFVDGKSVGSFGLAKIENSPFREGEGRCAFITVLAIHDPYQRKGIGTQIVDEIKRFGRPIYLFSAGEANHFWERMGFKMTDNTNALFRYPPLRN